MSSGSASRAVSSISSFWKHWRRLSFTIPLSWQMEQVYIGFR